MVWWLACPPLMHVGFRFTPWWGHIKDYPKNGTNCLRKKSLEWINQLNKTSISYKIKINNLPADWSYVLVELVWGGLFLESLVQFDLLLKHADRLLKCVQCLVLQLDLLQKQKQSALNMTQQKNKTKTYQYAKTSIWYEENKFLKKSIYNGPIQNCLF